MTKDYKKAFYDLKKIHEEYVEYNDNGMQILAKKIDIALYEAKKLNDALKRKGH